MHDILSLTASEIAEKRDEASDSLKARTERSALEAIDLQYREPVAAY